MPKMVVEVDGKEITDPFKIRLKKPALFDGKEVPEVDISPLRDWTGEDLIRTQKEYARVRGEDFSAIKEMVPEVDLEYDFYVASKASGLPMEFFLSLPAREAFAIKTGVVSFFYGED